ncbi:MAG: PAS domain S-box protein [Bacteroidota bacterium]
MIVEKPSSILIVDDVNYNVSFLEFILAPLQIEIITAYSGKEALAKIQNQNIALALIDINMPVMSGIELAQIITADHTRDRVPIIFVTAYLHDDNLLSMCYAAGGVDYIMKPINKEILLSKVRLFLELDNQKRQLIDSKQKLEILSAELSNIFDLSQDLVCIIDLDGLVFIKVNPAFTATLGYKATDLIGSSIASYVHPDDISWGADNIKSGQNVSNELISFESRFRCADGLYKWMNWVSHIVRENGLAYTIARDVTLRREAEEKIRKSEQMYRTLLNASPEGIIITDLNGIITEVSEIMLELFEGGTKEEFIGKPFFSLLKQTDHGVFQDIISKTKEDGLVQNVSFLMLSLKKSPLVTEISTTLIQDAEGNSQSFMAIIRDVSSRIEMEQQLIQSERMTGIGEMATSIAHEINQPLNNISLSLENLIYEIKSSTSVDQAYIQKKSNNIFENIHRMENIIDHLRAFARGVDDTFHGLFDVNESTRNAVMLVSEQFHNNSIELKTNFDENISNLFGNTYKFEQVIINLLINAKDAIEEKSSIVQTAFEKQVIIITRLEGQKVAVIVEDNGNGILPEVMDKIMRPFFSTKKAGKGTGLGLTIISRIIKEMNGEIQIESEPGSGTKMKIVLPIQ